MEVSSDMGAVLSMEGESYMVVSCSYKRGAESSGRERRMRLIVRKESLLKVVK